MTMGTVANALKQAGMITFDKHEGEAQVTANSEFARLMHKGLMSEVNDLNAKAEKFGQHAVQMIAVSPKQDMYAISGVDEHNFAQVSSRITEVMNKAYAAASSQLPTNLPGGGGALAIA